MVILEEGSSGQRGARDHGPHFLLDFFRKKLIFSFFELVVLLQVEPKTRRIAEECCQT